MIYRSCEELPAVLSLDELAAVPWADLQHAYGEAADIPEQLLAFAGPPPASQEAAGSMWGNIFHQGTRYTASPFTVPFFVGLLDRLDLRVDLVERLQALAYGYEDGMFPDGYDTARTEERQRNIDDSLNAFGVDAAHTHHAVSRAWSQIVPLLDDPNPQVSFETAHLLAYLPEHAPGSVRELRSRLPRLSADVLPSALLALGVLGHQHPGLVDITDVSIDPTTTESRIASLCARCVLEDETSIHLLIDALSDELPSIGSWLDGSTLTLVTASIATHEGWLSPVRLEAVGEQLRRAPMQAAMWVARILLNELVPRVLPERADQLSQLQRRALELLLASSAWGTNGSIYVDWSNLLDSYIVPSTQAHLAQYLAGTLLSESLAPHVKKRLARPGQ